VEYRGVEYAVVHTISKGWRRSVTRQNRNDKVGKAFARDDAIRSAKEFIDNLV
jgi:hypothetical protein